MLKYLKKTMMTLLLLCLFAGNSHAAGGYGNSGAQDSIYLKNAKNFIKMKNYVSAEQLLKTESVRDSLNADVWNLLGFTSRKLKKYEQSEAAYERALKLNPHHKGALEYMGELYITLGENIKAKELLTRLKKVCPSGCEELDALEKTYASKYTD